MLSGKMVTREIVLLDNSIWETESESKIDFEIVGKP